MYDLSVFIQALTANNGSVSKTANDLGMPVHTVKSKIAEHAELQAIVTNRDIEIADISRDIILDVLQDESVTDLAKLSTAKWALENLASDVYNKKQTIDVNARPIEELPAAELEARKAVVQAKLIAPKIVESFDNVELQFADPYEAPALGGASAND